MSARILVLWNQVDEDVYENLRAEGPQSLEWDPATQVPQMMTVAEELQGILKALAAGGHQVAEVNIRDDVRVLTTAIEQHRPDAVLNLIEFFGDDLTHESHIAGLFELYGIPYTGSRPLALTLCQQKHRAKALLRDVGLPTAPSFTVTGQDDLTPPADHGLRYPLIVKPAFEDASAGIDLNSVVSDHAALVARIAFVAKEHSLPILVEEYIDGREIHCAILGNDPPVALPLFEMEFVERTGDDGKPLPKVVTFHAKWDPTHRDYHAVVARCPARDLDPAVVAHLQETAIKAYRALNCRDYARVDMRLDARTGDPYILEVNPNPDLADECAFVRAAIASGRTFQMLVNEIAGFALSRKRVRRTRRRGPTDQLLREYRARKTP